MEKELKELSEIGDTNEKWNDFYKKRDEKLYDWYADWSEVGPSLVQHLDSDSIVLIPGCGDSEISEKLYENGVKNITNVDYSKHVIEKMRGRCGRDKPAMSWRQLDMTNLGKFKDNFFDVVIDKCGLDALTVSEIVFMPGRQYLSEVSRVLKDGGKFICFTHAKPQVLGTLKNLGLFFRKFRYGFKTSLLAIPRIDKHTLQLQVLMVICEKLASTTAVENIILSFDRTSINCHSTQACGLYETLDHENKIRSKILREDVENIIYSVGNLLLGVKGDMSKLKLHRRIDCVLGEQGVQSFCYRASIVDDISHSPQDHCMVLLVLRFSKKEEREIVKNSCTARLIMVYLEIRHDDVLLQDLRKELGPLVKQLVPESVAGDTKAEIKYAVHPDDHAKEDLYKMALSDCIGPITIRTAIFEESTIKLLTFARGEGFEQYVTLKGTPSKLNKSSGDNLEVRHAHLCNYYHLGIISGLVLMSSYLKRRVSSKNKVKVIIAGLGAGLLPMYLHKQMSYMRIEVLERDLILRAVAEKHFGFSADDKLKIHRKEVVDFLKNLEKIDILIIDVPSISKPWHVLVSPPSALVEQSFFESVKKCLNKEGLFVLNLIIRSPAHKFVIYSRMKEVFPSVYCFLVVEDFHEILYGCCSEVADLDTADLESINLSTNGISMGISQIIKLK